MSRADETAGKIETVERPSVGTAGSDDRSAKQLPTSLEDFLGASHQSRPAEDLHNLLLRIGHHLDYEHAERKNIDSRLAAIENQTKTIGSQTKRRASRAFVRYLVAICIGVVSTLAWQSYGDEAKQTMATRAPELGWSPEVKQMIASWTKPLASPERTAARPSASETLQAAHIANTTPEPVAPSAPTVPSFDPEQAKQIAQSLDALRLAVERLTDVQDQMKREITGLHTADLEILAKIPSAVPPVAPARKPTPMPSPPRVRPASLAPHP